MAKEYINSWKIEKYPVSADVAKAELDRIYEKHGKVTAKNIVDESRDTNAALHQCFEWRDDVAAEKYREEQARDLIRCLVTVEKSIEDEEPIIVRAYVKTTEKYEPISVALKSEDKYAVLIQDVLNDIFWFKRKYSNFTKLKGVFDAMDSFEEEVRMAM